MTRARRDLRWREQAARLVAAAHSDRPQRHLASSESYRFDVALVRAYCERLISEADALDLQREVFADWTRDRGMGPENRDGGAFVPIDLNELAILPPPPTVPLRWRIRFHRFYPRDVVIRLSAHATTPEAIAAEIHKGRGMLDARCINGRVVLSMRGGWPGSLAREYVATQRARRRCSRRDCEGGVLTGDFVKHVSAAAEAGGSMTITATDDGCGVACPECERFAATRTLRNFANGGTLRRAAQRLLDTLGGRCPWAPEAEAQPDECLACSHVSSVVQVSVGMTVGTADGGRFTVMPGSRVGLVTSPDVVVTSADGQPRNAVVGEAVLLPCSACSGTGHNLRGTLPPLPAETVERLTPTPTAEETPEWDGWPLPVAE